MAAGRAATAELDVLVVGAGPTGLALALQAAAHGARVCVVDRRDGSPRPSRALVVQPRTLEVLEPSGAAERLLAAGDTDVGAVLHTRGRAVPVDLGDLPLADTAHRRLLLVPQATVEATLLGLLAERGVEVRWGVEVTDLRPGREDLRGATCALDRGGRVVEGARFVVGCDGARSTVRARAGIAFPGRPYRHPVVVADTELAHPRGLTGAHVFAGRDGILFLFPLGERATWRLVVAGPAAGRSRTDGGEPQGVFPGVAEALPAMVHSLSDGAVSLGDVAWVEQVPLRHHLAQVYRRGAVLLAGDAAHVHSPAGAQGMNTGLQDACNLGWKLALAATSPPGAGRLLDSYERERRPVARLGTAWTSLAWWGESSPDPVARVLRRVVVPALAPGLARHLAVVAPGVRLVTGLALTYRHPVVPGTPPVSGVGGHVRVGDRLPDLELPRPPIADRGPPHRLYELVGGPGHHLLLLGDRSGPGPEPGLPPGWVRRVHLPAARGGDELARRLGLASPAWCLVRPDRHVAAVGCG